jgi:hypothetical protein
MISTTTAITVGAVLCLICLVIGLKIGYSLKVKDQKTIFPDKPLEQKI